jgi:tRNA(fMet)-specific endonuclease VapC
MSPISGRFLTKSTGSVAETFSRKAVRNSRGCRQGPRPSTTDLSRHQPAIDAINGKHPRVRRNLEAGLADRTAIGMPVIVFYELSYGIRKSARPQSNADDFAAFVSLGLAFPFEPEDAEEAAEIRLVLERAGAPIGLHDVLIAAQSSRRYECRPGVSCRIGLR